MGPHHEIPLQARPAPCLSGNAPTNQQRAGPALSPFIRRLLQQLNLSIFNVTPASGTEHHIVKILLLLVVCDCYTFLRVRPSETDLR